MKKILIILFTIPLLLGANENLTIEKIKKQNLEIKKEIFDLKAKYEFQTKMNETTINSISNQLTAASYNLTLFGILFALGAIALGVYSTYIERKVTKMSEENKLLLSKTKAIKDEVETINKLIQADIYGLFLKIKREETIHILNRLLKIPEDITNFLQKLLSRELEQEDFLILKKAYLEIKKASVIGDYKYSYQLLFFQHFFDLSVKDNEIGPDLIDQYARCINCAFENDIIKSTTDFIKTIYNLGLESRNQEINSFISGLSQSKFANIQKIYEIFFDSLSSRDNRFKFYNLISDDDNTKIGKTNFGKLIIDKYMTIEDLTEFEKLTIEKINNSLSS